jgi:ATP-dependent Clp protease ATP-binding subunit ClpC
MADFPQDGLGAFDEFLARYLQGERARSARSIDLSRFLSARTQSLLQRAAAFAHARGQQEMDALHVLRVLLDDDTVARAVARVGAELDALRSETEQRLPQESLPVHSDEAVITPAVQRAMFHAYQVARSAGATYIDPEHVFFALVLAQDSPAGQILSRAGVTPEALTQGAR